MNLFIFIMFTVQDKFAKVTWRQLLVYSKNLLEIKNHYQLLGLDRKQEDLLILKIPLEHV